MVSQSATNASHSDSRTRLTRWPAGIAILAAAGILGAFLNMPRAMAAGPTTTVTMTDQPAKFVPEKLTVKSGTQIVWKNTGQTLHSVTFDPSKAAVAGHVVLPAGVKPFDSGFMPPGGTYTQTLTTPGTYKYICIPHEKTGMLGEVTVTK